jgi:hypothetical protein
VIRFSAVRISVAAMALVAIALFSFYMVAKLETDPQVTTDAPAYKPWSTVLITGTGMDSGVSYDVVVVRPDDSVVTATQPHNVIPPAPYDTVVADGAGTFEFSYFLTNLEGFYDVNIYRSSDTAHATLIATTTFEDAIVTNLDQCTNGAPNFIDWHCDWQNGNINASNSLYGEGQVVPYRFEIGGLPMSSGTHTFEIEYDFSKSGPKSFDFLVNYNETQTGADPCNGSAAAPSLCPVPVTPPQCFPFPSDPYLAPALSVAGAEAASGQSRCLGSLERQRQHR